MPIACRRAAWTGSPCVPSPCATSAPVNGSPSTAPRILQARRVPNRPGHIVDHHACPRTRAAARMKSGVELSQHDQSDSRTRPNSWPSRLLTSLFRVAAAMSISPPSTGDPSKRIRGTPVPIALTFAATTSRASGRQRRCAAGRSVLLSALSREVGVATEMLLTKAEQVSDEGRAPPDCASAAMTLSVLRLERRDALPRRQIAAQVPIQGGVRAAATRRRRQFHPGRDRPVIRRPRRQVGRGEPLASHPRACRSTSRRWCA